MVAKLDAKSLSESQGRAAQGLTFVSYHDELESFAERFGIGFLEP